MAALVSRGLRRHTARGELALGDDLRDAREEMFCRMACDGLSLGVAFARAGFTSKDRNAPYNLFQLPRIKARAEAILEARRSSGVVSLGEVTDMLKRVFAGAHSAEEYSAAHNAAFSLARLYGHVTDRATLEVIRRPSRDPDAPSEQALASWVQDLPALTGPGPSPEMGPGPVLAADFLRVSGAPAVPLGPEPLNIPNDFNGLDSSEPSSTPRPGPSGPELSNDIKGLRGEARGRTENGAPVGPVTVTPTTRAHSGLSGPEGPGVPEKGAPVPSGQVPVLAGGFPKFEDLF